MEGVDPNTLLEWLQTGCGLERDLQLMALEQLCMLLLMSDNIDRCFESCPPRTFIPALCQIFLDETAPDNVLEVTARAITYYLDVSNECTRRITQVEGAVKAICTRLSVAEMNDRTSKDLAEQCVKLLEHVCQREGPAVYEAGGLQCMLVLVRQNGHLVHKDTLHSAMAVVMRLCGRVEPQDAAVRECTVGLGELLAHEDARVSESALRCFAALTDRYIRKSLDPSELAESSNLVEHLLDSLLPSAVEQNEAATNKPASFISIVLSLLSNLCRGSARVTDAVVSSPKLVPALKAALSSKDERCVLDSLRLADLLVILLCEGRGAFTKSNVALVGGDSSANSLSYDRAHRYLIDVIRQRDTDALIDAVENGSVDPNFTDDVGQTLLNWCAAFGTIDMVQYLCDKGADVNRGQRSSSLHYAACFGRADVLIALLSNGANPDLRDEDGRTALDKARERADESHQQVIQILESPTEYMISSRKKKRSNTESTTDGGEKRAESEDPAGQIDPQIVRSVIQQLIPVFCVVFTDSMASSVCRATLSLINKSIKYCPTDAFEELVQGSACKETADETDEESSSNFVERLMKVVVTVFNEETNVEGHENVIMILKSLFTKNPDFWLEQLIRLGIVEKVEQLAQQADKGDVVVTSTPAAPASASAVSDSLDIFAQEPMDTTTIGGEEFVLLAGGTPSAAAATASTFGSKGATYTPATAAERSATSTPSIGLRSESEASRDTPQPTTSEHAAYQTGDRSRMLNIPVQFEDEMISDTNTPPPTIENHEDSGHSHAMDTTDERRAIADLPTPRAPAPAPPTDRFASTTSKESSAERAAASTTAPSAAEGLPNAQQADVWTLQSGHVLKWRDWRLMRAEDSLFIWCDAVALELNDASNGWFRFYLDGRLHTIYSSGPAESGPDNAETRGEFVRKFQTFRSQAGGNGAQPKPIYSQPHAERRIESGNWRLSCTAADELVIVNVENGGEVAPIGSPSAAGPSNANTNAHDAANTPQQIVIKEDLPGFSFEASKFSTRKFIAESTLGCSFVTGWAARGGDRRLKFRSEAQRQKIHELAKDLWETHLKDARNKPRDVFVELRSVSEELQKCAEECTREQENFQLMPKLKEKLTRVRDLIVNERLLSTFELASSGVVPALLELVRGARAARNGVIYETFHEVFEDESILSSTVRRIVEVLEFVEKFEQVLYDSNGGSAFGLQLLTRRLRFSMQQADTSAQSDLLNRTGRILRTEPLATVGQLRTFLHRMVSKMWFDHPRDTMLFVRELKGLEKRGEPLSLQYESDFDTNGLIWYLGTNARSTSEWTNPAAVGVVAVRCSDGSRMPYGSVEDVLSRDTNPMNCHSSDSKDAAITIDLGVLIKPTAYSLRHSRGYAKSALRTWDLEGSLDNKKFFLLSRHENDTSLNESGSTATFVVDGKQQDKTVRYVRIQQRGVNSSGVTHFISLSGFEIYGDVVGVTDEPLQPPESAKPAAASSSTATAAAGASSASTPTTSGAGGSAIVFGKSKHQHYHVIPPRSSAGLQLQREKEAAKSKKAGQSSASPKAPALRPQRKAGATSSSGINPRFRDQFEEFLPPAAVPPAATTGGTPASAPADFPSRSAPQPATTTAAAERPAGDRVQNVSVNMYNEMLRVGQIESIEDIGEFERVVLAHQGILDEVADEEEIDEDASTTDDDALHERRRQFQTHHDRAHDPASMLVDELAFIDARDVSGIHFGSAAIDVSSGEVVGPVSIGSAYDDEMSADESMDASQANSSSSNTAPISAHPPAATSAPSNSSGFLPLRSDFVRILTEAAAARRQAGGSNEAGGSSGMAALLNHDFVLQMLESAGYRSEISPIGSSGRGSTAGHQYRANTGGRNTRRPTRVWDDEYPSPAAASTSTTAAPSAPLVLRLSGPGAAESSTVVVNMEDDNETIFSVVQRLFNRTAASRKATDRARKIWEQTYTVVYENPADEPEDATVDEEGDEKDEEETAGGEEWESPKNAVVRQTLEVLRQLHFLAGDRASETSFISAKLTQKLQQELADPLVVAAGAFPTWAELLIYRFPCLFSLETRNSFLRATAFGTSRAIVWLQSRRDQLLEEARSSGAAHSSSLAGVRREDYPEFRIGRIKHERIKVHRSDEHLFENAVRVMKFHAARKAVLEIEYLGEEGTGLGPTLEFYALVAAEFQRKSLAMFLCDDEDHEQQRLEADSLDLGEGTKPPGYYVRRAGGLFPAPAPQGSAEAERIAESFRILGIFLAKVLQDSRLVDLPLSLAFLRLLTSDSVAGSNEGDLEDVNLDGLLGLADLEEIHSHKAKFLRSVQRVCMEKADIRADSSLSAHEKHRRIAALRLEFNGEHGTAAHECRIEELGLTFVVNPPSAVFQYDEHELIPNGANTDVTIDNIELYLGKCVDFYLNSGIRQQVKAFREGFDSVFPLRSLKMLTPYEVQKLLSGEQYPEWTREDLINFTEPKLGYTRDSAGFLRFVDVVAAMSPAERKAFLQFTTGCSSLPPGGLANLHPRLTVVRKVDAGGDGSYPSVNTCVHYLKLPEYSTADVLRERLLAATHEKGFHLN
ncbi:HECT-type E3 ubiquitin transferase [Aphelenchoides fujianensis]|nr:HECT-type E3 ubiquitin transferase [Aphelenchoides fujianensis]